MAHQESDDRRRLNGLSERRSSWLPMFLLGIALALAAATFAIYRDPLSIADWIGIFVVMMLAFALELVAFERVD